MRTPNPPHELHEPKGGESLYTEETTPHTAQWRRIGRAVREAATRDANPCIGNRDLAILIGVPRICESGGRASGRLEGRVDIALVDHPIAVHVAGCVRHNLAGFGTAVPGAAVQSSIIALFEGRVGDRIELDL